MNMKILGLFFLVGSTLVSGSAFATVYCNPVSCSGSGACKITPTKGCPYCADGPDCSPYAISVTPSNISFLNTVNKSTITGH